MPKRRDNEKLRGEFIGRHVRIESSDDPNQVGLRGWIVDETRNTLRIEAAPTWDVMFPDGEVLGRLRTIPKAHTKVVMGPGPAMEGERLDLDRVMFRPEDRNKRLRRSR